MDVGYKCPKCGGTRLTVKTAAWFHVHQEEDGHTSEFSEMAEGWDDNDTMFCEDCDGCSSAKGFKWKAPPEGAVDIFGEKG